jgi:DMSO reductase anchor subunit
MVIAGVLIFVLGVEKIHKVLIWWEGKSEEFRRAWAVAAAIIGVLLIYSA